MQCKSSSWWIWRHLSTMFGMVQNWVFKNNYYKDELATATVTRKAITAQCRNTVQPTAATQWHSHADKGKMAPVRVS